MRNRVTNPQNKIIFIIDSIRIGGIERLCFDECYELIDRKIDHEILCLTNSVIPEGSILAIDKNYSKFNEINLTFIGRKRIIQILKLARILLHNNNKRIKIISHSTRGSVIARISTAIIFKKIHITLFIHQLISLSDTKQKIKRMIHSLFADDITTSSFQFKLAWEEYVNSNLMYRVFFRKKIKFNRMGVHLPRLKDSVKNEIQECSQVVIHLLFMSRITNWKGFPIFNKVCKLMEPMGIHSMVISNENSRKNIFEINSFQNEKNHYVPNNGISNIKFTSKVIHLYPTNYGPGTLHPQSIGMNVIECLAVGIPSLISFDEFETWPEFRTSSLIRTVDWENEVDILSNLQHLLELDRNIIDENFLLLEDVINIAKHVDQILNY